MEEKEVDNKTKAKHHFKHFNRDKKVESLEDLCNLLRNKTNQLYGDDEAMIKMVTRLIEGIKMYMIPASSHYLQHHIYL